MTLSTVNKRLQEEQRSLELKMQFLGDLEALMKKYSLNEKALIELLAGREDVLDGVAPRRRKAAAGAPRKRKGRKVRHFKNPKTGEKLETKAPQVNKTLREWAKANNATWQDLEV